MRYFFTVLFSTPATLFDGYINLIPSYLKQQTLAIYKHGLKNTLNSYTNSLCTNPKNLTFD